MAWQIHPIAAVEIEVSPWSYFDETKKGLDTCTNAEAHSDNSMGIAQ